LASASAYRQIPDCKIKVDGKPLELNDDGALTKVEVDLDVDLFGQCVLTFNDPKLKLMNGSMFESGVSVRVEIGFHTKLKKVFDGEVVALEPQFRRDMPPSFKVICQESLHRLALSQMTRAFNDVDDKEITTKIAQEHGLSANAPAGTKEHILQGNITDAAFLRRIAQKHGNHLRIEGKKLIIGPPPSGADVQVSPGDGLKKIKVQIKSVQQVKEISVHGWDPKTKKEIVGKAKGEGEIGKGSKEHGGKATLSFAGHEHAPSDVATAEKMAKGRMRKVAEGFVKAHGDMIGDPGVLPGSFLNLDKMGEKIDGRYRVEHSVHAFSKHGYFVNFKAVRVGKKKPPKPPKDGKHTWSTDDDDPEAKARGRDDKQGEGSKDKRNLRHLVLAYDSGPSVDAAADADWDKKNNKPDVDDLEFKYRWSVDGPTAEEQLDWAKVKNERLEKLRFGLVEAESESDEHVADRTKADHKPQLQGLSEQIVGSAGGGGSGSGDT
jgi:phage protein D